MDILKYYCKYYYTFKIDIIVLGIIFFSLLNAKNFTFIIFFFFYNFHSTPKRRTKPEDENLFLPLSPLAFILTFDFPIFRFSLVPSLYH